MSGWMMGLGLGLGNVQKSMADYFAQQERERIRQEEIKFRDSQVAYQHGRDQKQDNERIADRFVDQAAPNTDVTPEMAKLMTETGNGSRLRTLAPIQAKTMTGVDLTGGAGAMKPQDLSQQARQVIAPNFQQQNALDEILRHQTERKEDLGRHTLERGEDRNYAVADRATGFKNQLALQDDAQAAAAALQDRALANAVKVAGINHNTASGRPLLSTDANKLIDIQTAMKDMDRLGATILPKPGQGKSTGLTASLGASAPNFVTEFTGFGADAKKNQALIALIKQTFGKTLEGGVLRKEDEIKYKDILPALGDTADIVASKLNGLKAVMTDRLHTHLEGLGEAGYNVDGVTAGAQRRAAQTGQPTATRPTITKITQIGN